MATSEDGEDEDNDDAGDAEDEEEAAQSGGSPSSVQSVRAHIVQLGAVGFVRLPYALLHSSVTWHACQARKGRG